MKRDSLHLTNVSSSAPPTRLGVRVAEVVRVDLPTTFGIFTAHAFECSNGLVYIALVAGHVEGESGVLARVHSECLTGDAFGSLRCDCGVQLRNALRSIAVEGRGLLIYATGHEGRGIGLLNKLRAYVEQDLGADTVDANLHLGLPVDDRDYGVAAAILRDLDVKSIRLITNNPAKMVGLRDEGVRVDEIESFPVAPHTRNAQYLRTKQQRMGHVTSVGTPLAEVVSAPADVTRLLGDVRAGVDRPYVAVKYAQSIDGRIATRTGDSKWISSEKERAVSHALRARCDAIMVGVETVNTDDPALTVRMVPGASPARVILDSTLRIALRAQVLNDDAPTIILTTDEADPAKRAALRSMNVGVHVVPRGSDGVDIQNALTRLYDLGIRSLIVEGGGRVITSLLTARLVDRVIVAFAPRILGAGVEAVGDLGTSAVLDGVALTDRCVQLVGNDVVMAFTPAF